RAVPSMAWSVPIVGVTKSRVEPGVAGPPASGSSPGSFTICDLMWVIFIGVSGGLSVGSENYIRRHCKNPKPISYVMLAKAGIQELKPALDPGLRRNDGLTISS